MFSRQQLEFAFDSEVLFKGKRTADENFREGGKEDNLTKGFRDITRTSAPSILQNNEHLSITCELTFK